jgi:hypothetical protein
MSIPNFSERKEAAEKARQAMLEKFKAKPQIDPAAAAERAAQAQAREAKRAAAEEKRKQRVLAEKTQRIEDAKLKAMLEVEEAERKAREEVEAAKAAAEAAEILAFEQKARRDLKYAARKARQGGKR